MMKTNITSKVHVDQRLLREIETEVRETIAVDVAINIPSKRKFTVADMWKIHRQKKQIVGRRAF